MAAICATSAGVSIKRSTSAEVRNQKPGTDVSKNVILKRGETYAGPYAGPGDYDLHVKARTMDDLAGAKKVAEYYGVKLDIQPNTDSTKNYYKYVGIFRDLR